MKLCTKLRVNAARINDDVLIIGRIDVVDFGPVAEDHEFGVDVDGFLHMEGNAMMLRREPMPGAHEEWKP